MILQFSSTKYLLCFTVCTRNASLPYSEESTICLRAIIRISVCPLSVPTPSESARPSPGAVRSPTFSPLPSAPTPPSAALCFDSFSSEFAYFSETSLINSETIYGSNWLPAQLFNSSIAFDIGIPFL